MSTTRDINEMFRSPEWYDQSINWSARIGREIPVLTDVFGAPGSGGIIDAGCGTGRQAMALASKGYRVVGADLSDDMLNVARRHARDESSGVEFVHSSYADLFENLGGGFDGLYCLGNALAAAGSSDAVVNAIDSFSKCLRVGGRLFLQVLNFEPMRKDSPCVRGPRVANVDGQEYVSVRHFHFGPELATVTNITIYHDGGWKQRSHGGSLYPVGLDEMKRCCEQSGLHVDHVWGGYDSNKREFVLDHSTDLIVVATRK